jgi:threonine dehydratase
MEGHPGLSDVRAAQERIGGMVVRTPVVRSRLLPVELKMEQRQRTGSFKLRGAANRLLTLTEEERRRGVVAVSSGNHGRAVAAVAGEMRIDAVVCLSARVPPVKVEAIEALGARVVVAGPSQDEADAEARRLVVEEGRTFVHPFDDPMVIAGQGTVGLEISEQTARLSTVVVPLSGGGLISGIAAALAEIDPGVRVIGVSQDRGPAMHLSLQAGRLVDVVEEDTLADALAGGLGPENHHTFEMCRNLLDGTVLVGEAEIAAAMAALHDEEGEVVEGGGAVAYAAVMAGRVGAGEGTVVVLSGGNVGDDTLARVVRP